MRLLGNGRAQVAADADGLFGALDAAAGRPPAAATLPRPTRPTGAPPRQIAMMLYLHRTGPHSQHGGTAFFRHRSTGLESLTADTYPRYAAALQHLVAHGWAYPCRCSRKAIDAASAALGLQRPRHGERIYPGTCRPTGRLGAGADAQRAGLEGGSMGGAESGELGAAAAWRLDVAAAQHALVLPSPTRWHDRRLGAQQQLVALEVGDFVLQRADGLWAYQLAVVVDDAAEGITHVVRGEDLADNTARQILLQGALGLPMPAYLHTPLVLGADGRIVEDSAARAGALVAVGGGGVRAA